MKISQSSWKKYVEKLSKINKSAAEQVKQYIKSSGIDLTGDVSSLISYCYGISTAYGEAAATLAAEMYDTVAYLEGANVAAAELADTATYPEVAKTVNGIIQLLTCGGCGIWSLIDLITIVMKKYTDAEGKLICE